MRALSGSITALAAALLVAACGGSDRGQQESLRPDDAFVVRIARHQSTALELARSAAEQARGASVRRLARRMVAAREKRLPALMEHLARVPSQRGLPDLGVSAAEAAEGIGPDALAGAQPPDAAFLTLMTQHDHGAIALAKAELGRGRDPAVKAVAERVAADSAAELARLSDAMVVLARRG